MIFVVIAYGSPTFEPGKAGDAPFRSHRYRERLIQEGKIVVHGHLAGQKGHLWVYNVSGTDELDRVVAEDLMLPFNRDLRNPDGSVKTPRYYQTVAIDRAVEDALAGKKRMLVTMATGTGKTFVALQVVWKLWNSRWKPRRKPRVLYLADRNILVDQPIAREFRPVFGDAVWKIQGAPKTGREVYFALYQSMADSGDAAPDGDRRHLPILREPDLRVFARARHRRRLPRPVPGPPSRA